MRTVPSDAEIVVGITQAMKQFGWSRIALITQSENIFTFVSCCKIMLMYIAICVHAYVYAQLKWSSITFKSDWFHLDCYKAERGT